MTRAEKIAIIRENVSKRGSKLLDYYKDALSHCLELDNQDEDSWEELFDDCIIQLYITKSLLWWIKSDPFCNEQFPNGNYVLSDRNLDIMMREDCFDFIARWYTAMFDLKSPSQEESLHIASALNDEFIRIHMIDAFDAWLLNQKKENLQGK